jgi:hypothetical protein
VARARKKATGATIPLTAKTFSKSYLQYLRSPQILETI